LEPNGKTNDLEDALTRLLHSPQSHRQALLRLVQAAIPILAVLVFNYRFLLSPCTLIDLLQPSPGGKTVDEARTKMVNIAKKLLADSKANIKAGEKASATKRDLLSLMVESNMSTDIREYLRLSDTDVIARRWSCYCAF
jgi:cytochrome P450